MGKRIKILYTIPNFDTAGSGKVVYDLVKDIDKSVFDPEICCFHNGGSFFKTIETLGVKIHIFQFATAYRPFMTFPFRVFKIYRFLKQHQFDLIHSWHWSSDFSEPLAAKLAGIPFLYTKKSMGWGNKAWIWKSKLSSHIIAINDDMMTLFFHNMRDKVEQIPLGVDIEYFHPLPKSYKSSDGIVLRETDFAIVSIANLVPVKGIEVLLKAVRQLKDKRIKVLIIGNDESDYGTELKSTFKDDHIYFLGKKLDVRPYLALADVFVIPTKDEGRKEGMPIAPLEAMASQRIVLGSNISGISDILLPFPGCLFIAGNIEDLANKLKKIMEMTNEEREQLAKEMQSHVNENFELKNCIKNHEKLYQQLINK